MSPLRAAEIISHPEFSHVLLDLKPTKKGKAYVGGDRSGGPFHIAYEVHGEGPLHLVFVMGLGAMKWAWQQMTKDLGHDQSSKYSCLVFDNRGIGESDKPSTRYSTSEMARDTQELLDHLGWTEQRQLHVLGVSMGGMIAQELGLLIPERIASLSLASTAARLVNTVGFFENLRSRINMFIPRPIDIQLQSIKAQLFSQAWLNAADDEYIVEAFPTKGDRFAALELRKRRDTEGFTRKGFILQAIAAGWHHKSAAQIKELGDRVGRDRIQVVYGSIDRMITPPHGQVLVNELGGEAMGTTVVIFEGRGHVLCVEERKRFERVLEAFVNKTAALDTASRR